MENTEVLGIGVVAVTLFAAFTAIVLKMWKEHTKLTVKLLEMSEKQSTSAEKLANAISNIEKATNANTEVTRATGELTKQTRDTISELILNVLRGQSR